MLDEIGHLLGGGAGVGGHDDGAQPADGERGGGLELGRRHRQRDRDAEDREGRSWGSQTDGSATRDGDGRWDWSSHTNGQGERRTWNTDRSGWRQREGGNASGGRERSTRWKRGGG